MLNYLPYQIRFLLWFFGIQCLMAFVWAGFVFGSVYSCSCWKGNGGFFSYLSPDGWVHNEVSHMEDVSAFKPVAGAVGAREIGEGTIEFIHRRDAIRKGWTEERIGWLWVSMSASAVILAALLTFLTPILFRRSVEPGSGGAGHRAYG